MDDSTLDNKVNEARTAALLVLPWMLSGGDPTKSPLDLRIERSFDPELERESRRIE